MRGFFSGAHLNGIDAKNRLSVPAGVRDVIEARSAIKSLVLAPAEHAPCLVGYDLTHFEQQQARIDLRFASDFGAERSAYARAMFGMAETLRYDDTGRIVVPPILRELGELGAQALFLGAGDYFELWSPDRLLASDGVEPRLARTVQALLAQRGR